MEERLSLKFKGAIIYFIFIYLFLSTALLNAGTFYTNQQPMGVNQGVGKSSIAFGDIDNDGDLDIALTGEINSVPDRRFIIYRNDAGIFTNVQEPMGINQGVNFSSIAFGDIDNDGDPDLAVTGRDSGGVERFIIYRNDEGIFTNVQEPMGVNQGVRSSSIAFGDYDNDGDPDIALTGEVGFDEKFIIFRNDEGVFSNVQEPMGTNRGVTWSSIAFGDYDNDSDLDIALTGYDYSYRYFQIYRNDSGVFNLAQEPMGVNQGVYWSSIAFGDIDNDDDLDIAVAGSSGGNYRFIIYHNDAGTFNLAQEPLGLEGVCDGSIAFGDIDNDNDPDIVLTGETLIGFERFIIFRNDSGVFTNIQEPLGTNQHRGIEQSSVAFGDIDNDGDLDLAVTGYDDTNPCFIIYTNSESTKNNVPSAPTGLSSVDQGGYWRFQWNHALDDHTSPGALHYRIAIGINSGVYNYASTNINLPRGQANPGNIPQGGIGTTCFFQSRIPVTKKIYWKVCAIDTAFKAGDWSLENITGSLYSRITGLEPSEGNFFIRYGDIKGEAFSAYKGENALDYVEIRIRNMVQNTYWDGAQWVLSTNTWLKATGKEEWEYCCRGIDWAFNERHYAESRPVIVNGERGSIGEGMEFIPVYQLSKYSFCNYPNPFNPNREKTCIEYLLLKEENVKILIFDVSGKIANEWNFYSGQEGAREGINRIYWDGRNKNGYILNNNVYLCFLKIKNDEKVIKIVILK
ncbi:MAG: VCBS repeat-containing protein [Spirochaetes bacterium]|nr:VCBS repeat-containing protein [Spirochaetota bacterium]